MNITDTVYSVSQVNRHIRDLLDRDQSLNGIFVRGEISNYKAYPSGHHYFSLKDEDGAIRCVLFKRDAMRLRFRLQNGMKIIALGRVSVFPRDGQYQLYCNEITADGIGDLHIAFEQLKSKLFQEGLFDSCHKKAIPRYPAKIALITSSAGAAVWDMIRILGARWPASEVLVLPVRVQGREAPAELCTAIEWANQHQVADLIITGRGGGSMEDLWAFNEECVARAIYQSQIPVISAVGHEPDITISDFVADLRAATPSNGAELAVPDRRDVYAQLVQIQNRLSRAMRRQIDRARAALEHSSQCRILQDPMLLLDEKRQMLDYQQARLTHGLSFTMSKERERFAALVASLEALSPLKVLARGYAIPRKEDGTILRSAQNAVSNETITVQLVDGVLHCKTLSSLPYSLKSGKEAQHGRKKDDI